MITRVLQLKKMIFLVIIFLSLGNLFSQEGFQTTISTQVFKLIEKTYHDMENSGIDLAEYRISIHIENNILYVLYRKPYLGSIRGSPPGYPTLQYEVDIVSGEIINIRGFR